ncbi:MAG: gliding motility-associated C-terminal domain-containing protein [Spirochaetales bacterium]|jgi:flagellar hook assembly protein FlgD/outer membrane protein OmpA-like peptidoglycan-associated protein|nr:gliding motility-associated C-terminal domain-containing protein [Spirochaetales bacterium]
MKARLCLIVFCCAGIAGLCADYNPPSGGEELYDLLSPLFLAGGPSAVSWDSPLAGALNPAAGGFNQRTSLETSYFALADFGDDGWEGHVINLGADYPTRYGVVTGSLQYISSTLDDMYLGQAGTFNASFSKDIYSDLLVGAGAHFTGGSAGRAGSSDFGAAADFGFIHIPADFFGLRDFRWGAVLRNVGKWYAPVDGRSGFPSPFTPVLGAGFTAFQGGGVCLDLRGDLSFPAMQNIRALIGAGLTLQDRVSINVSTRFDLRQRLDDKLASRGMFPSVGIMAVFNIDLETGIPAAAGIIRENEWEHSDIQVHAAAGPLHEGIWAMGAGARVNLGILDEAPPDVRIDYPGMAYISPNMDGVADALEIPLSITDARYVREYRLVIEDAAGNPVRVIENKEKRPENETLGTIVDRFLAEKKGIDIPAVLRWDGISDSGSRAADGSYTFHLEAADDNGNRAITEKYGFIIDTLPPQVTIQPVLGSDLIFSPNGDGNKDVLVISQTGSAEDLWEAFILDAAARPVRGFSWKDSAPQEAVWDGKDDAGMLLPDGVYSYIIASTDRAGNTSKQSLSNIIINTEATPINLRIDTSYFSPNGDGVLDTLTLRPLIPVTSGLEQWELTVYDDAAAAVRRYSGFANAPLPVVFDGRAEDGAPLPEGAYHASLMVVYRNGNRPRAESPVFFIDLHKPEANVWSDLTVFSPNGDGNRDTIEIYQESSYEEIWTGRILGASGTSVRVYTWQGQVDRSFIWNGSDGLGKLVPDGSYTYQLESTDRAGNTGVSNVLNFSINTEETPVILSADLTAFSPNRDGVKDTVRFTPVYKVTEGIEASVFTIRGAADSQEVLTHQIRGKLEGYTWDGRTQAGRTAPEGNYVAGLIVYYQNGNQSASKTGLIELDIMAPDISVSADTAIFSPDGDGLKDTVNFTQVSSLEPLWEGKIVNAENTAVKSFFWKGRVENFAWDGSDDIGNKAPDGVYSYIISAEDRAGNRTQKALRDIRVDRRPVTAFVTVSETGFSPNGDGFKDTAGFAAYLNLADGLETWRLDIEDSKGIVRKTFSGGDFTSPMTFIWDGRADDGRVYEDTYTARFSAVYAKGNRPRVSSTPFLLDITAPEAEIRLAPVPFSPDNDGIDDELTINFSVRDASPIDAWDFVINDRTGKMFNRFSGKGMPAPSSIWDGRSSTGELVLAAEDYPFVFTVSDILGNSRQVQGVIPVDILVIRDGDRLKIRISNINFAPNSPEVILDSSETGRKNLSILTRLVEVLTKYSAYQVIIEGHANNISGSAREEKEELQPLSLARAREVRNALVSLDLPARRITATGRGGEEMIFPFSDRDNNWKNRRVEFILVK